MTKNEALQTIKKMTVNANSVQVNDWFVVVRRNQNSWRLGEVCGEWLMSGTAEKVIERAFKE